MNQKCRIYAAEGRGWKSPAFCYLNNAAAGMPCLLSGVPTISLISDIIQSFWYTTANLIRPYSVRQSDWLSARAILRLTVAHSW
jgi:hypothetical protein